MLFAVNPDLTLLTGWSTVSLPVPTVAVCLCPEPLQLCSALLWGAHMTSLALVGFDSNPKLLRATGEGLLPLVSALWWSQGSWWQSLGDPRVLECDKLGTGGLAKTPGSCHLHAPTCSEVHA